MAVPVLIVRGLQLPPCPLRMPPADSKQLAEFWDRLGEGEKREVMDLSSEPNSEHIVRQVRQTSRTRRLA